MATSKSFSKSIPDETMIIPESSKYMDSADYLLIRNDKPGSYACKNEAFCDGDARGILASDGQLLQQGIVWFPLCDRASRRRCSQAHKAAVDKAVEDLQYGIMGVNNSAVVMEFFPHMMWGGNRI
jgi:hypothetical protein